MPARKQDRPHACLEGVVYIGHLVAGEDGNEVEVIEAIPCRRCADSTLKGGSRIVRRRPLTCTPLRKNPPDLSRIHAYVAYVLAEAVA